MRQFTLDFKWELAVIQEMIRSPIPRLLEEGEPQDDETEMMKFPLTRVKGGRASS